MVWAGVFGRNSQIIVVKRIQFRQRTTDGLPGCGKNVEPGTVRGDDTADESFIVPVGIVVIETLTIREKLRWHRDSAWHCAESI